MRKRTKEKKKERQRGSSPRQEGATACWPSLSGADAPTKARKRAKLLDRIHAEMNLFNNEQGRKKDVGHKRNSRNTATIQRQRESRKSSGILQKTGAKTHNRTSTRATRHARTLGRIKGDGFWNPPPTLAKRMAVSKRTANIVTDSGLVKSQNDRD